jgi:hypothetical protein
MGLARSIRAKPPTLATETDVEPQWSLVCLAEFLSLPGLIL